jgi:transcriptional regulator with XRE-family HTH domain
MYENQAPFKKLGDMLKVIRQKLQESVAEVSGAVEIDELSLERIEQGSERPSQDILNLLISHFAMHEEEATKLWKLAGYENGPLDFRDSEFYADNMSPAKSAVLIVTVDPRVIYSDSVRVETSDSGVVLTFSQINGHTKPMVASCVGMSRDQAKKVIGALQDALDNSGPRRLSDGGNVNKRSTNNS